MDLEFKKKYGWNTDTIKNLQLQLGYIPEIQAGFIGNKPICKRCVADMEGLLHFVYDFDD